MELSTFPEKHFPEFGLVASERYYVARVVERAVERAVEQAVVQAAALVVVVLAAAAHIAQSYAHCVPQGSCTRTRFQASMNANAAAVQVWYGRNRTVLGYQLEHS